MDDVQALQRSRTQDIWSNGESQDALKILDSRRRALRPIDQPKTPLLRDLMPGQPTFKGTPNLSHMKTWLHRLGHSDSDLDSLNVVHVAGTKGKGSTCAFTSCFLTAHGERTGFPKQVGLYTSPHLRRVQERIQLNNRPVSESVFAKYLFEVWDILSSHESPQPRYLQMLMLVATHTFIKERVDVAVYETHNGGEFDATNVFRRPIVTGVSNIGMDHVDQLGPSLADIVWHKAGIFKSESPAYSVMQTPQVAKALGKRATEKEVSLEYVNVDSMLPLAAPVLRPHVQKVNASLALGLTHAVLREKAPNACCDLASQDIARGVERFSWPGRFQQITQGNHQWFLDGAHNYLSMGNAAQWFAEVAGHRNDGSTTRILIFSHLSERDGAALLRSVAVTLQKHNMSIPYLILSTYHERMDGIIEADRCFRPPSQPFSIELQKEYIEAWTSVFPKTQAAFKSTIEDALNFARSLDEGNGIQALVTGSLYLVGGTLQLLGA